VAKGLEDTTLYVYHPLVSLNEVGGDPAPDAICPREFFEFIAERQKRWPHSMNASSTHDTKRAEDVRARISVLSEMPQAWRTRLHQWATMNEKYKIAGNGGAMIPDRNEEYFLYQTLLGMWPLEESELGGVLERLQSYAVKAIREAMVHTRWTRPNLAHEEGLKQFIAAILDQKQNDAFLQDFLSFHGDIAFYGMLNSLSQTLLKITAPGVPDFYQGSELWDLRLVDPDNRGTVDFARRIELLTSLKENTSRVTAGFASELLKTWTDGRIKLYLICKALRCRQDLGKLFTDGAFVPAEISGERSENVTAFFRVFEDQQALVVAPKWLAGSGIEKHPGAQATFWGNTSIVLPNNATASWRNVFTGEALTAQGNRHAGLSLSDALNNFPVALLLPNLN
jgi:(1->4)-alpha-D-glucan 1-alpha-D-glucosylmutase